jgi:hypothetical protein
MTARQWGQTYEWNAHYAIAIDEGLSISRAPLPAGAAPALAPFPY